MNDGVEAVGAFALIGVSSHQQDGQRRIITRGGERQRNAVHDRHANIGEQEIETPLLAHHEIERIAAVTGRFDLVTVGRKRPRTKGA
jgi:hypothetical protein